MIKLYHEIFGPNFVNNAAFVFTRWSMSKKSIREREEEGVNENLKEQ